MTHNHNSQLIYKSFSITQFANIAYKKDSFFNLYS